MKVATKTGDKGVTGLLSGERLSKSEKVFDALGDLDELNATIGLVKSIHQATNYDWMQLVIIKIMGELAYSKNDYIKKYDSLNESHLFYLDDRVEKLENTKDLEQKSWVLYGKTELGARLDFAAKVCRRAERKIVALNSRKLILQFINRLSDYLYLLAREADLCQN